MIEKLNPAFPSPAINLAIDELTRERVSSGMVYANQEIYKLLLKDGVKVLYRDEDGAEHDETVRVVDWDHPLENDFLLTSQFWISGEMHKRRADLIGFVNGIPLLFIELKASHKNVEDAFHKNLHDYNDTIPHLFWHTQGSGKSFSMVFFAQKILRKLQDNWTFVVMMLTMGLTKAFMPD